jgi:hypothetical protein
MFHREEGLQVTGLNRRRHGLTGFLLAVVLVLQTVVIGLIVARERSSRRENHDKETASLKQTNVWRENRSKAISRPRVVEAQKGTLQPDEEVVGIEVGGKSRAYRLGALLHPSGHLVNDLIGAVPVSVSYCNLSDCLRVYTKADSSEPLEIEVAGRYDSKMVLRVNGVLYFHESGVPVEPSQGQAAIPYEQLTPTRTNWKDWVTQHPDTDVYEGDRRPSEDES